MSKIWFVSDTHFNHANILTFIHEDKPLREFSNVKEMNEVIINNWNSLIRPNDQVFHLGDVFFGNKGEFIELWKNLNGKKTLIAGNHDNILFFAKHNLVEDILMGKLFRDDNFVATHAPVHRASLKDHYINVHGHLHRNRIDDPNYVNISIEMTDYCPVSYDEILAKIKVGFLRCCKNTT